MSTTKTTPKTGARAAKPATRENRAKYEQVADDLREQITNGLLPARALLPSESEMMARYGVSRPTARAAIAALRNEGLVTVIKRRGAFVRPAGDRPNHTDTRTITRPDSSNPAAAKGDRGSGAGYSDGDTDAPRWRAVEDPSTYHVNATPTLALAIGVAEHTPLLGCDRLLQDPAGRRVLHRLYLPLGIVADIPALEADPFVPAGPVYTALADAGHELTWTEYVTARNPNPDDAATLNIPEGTPIISTRRITRDANGQPLAMEETHRSAEDTQLSYSVTATAAPAT